MPINSAQMKKLATANIIKRRKTGLFASCLFLAAALPVFFAFALELNYPTFGGINVTNASTPSQYIRYVFVFGVGVVGLISLGALIWGAVQYITSEAVGNKQAAKERMTEALIGLALVLISVVVLSYINIGLVNLSDPVVPSV